MESGVVKWFNGEKGYGFIRRPNAEDVFVHYKAIVRSGYKTLNQGENVQFDIEKGPKGLQATNVTKTDDRMSVQQSMGGQQGIANPWERPDAF